jgi:hypothetical protein
MQNHKGEQPKGNEWEPNMCVNTFVPNAINFLGL